MKVLSVVDGTGWCGTKEQTYLITKGLAEKGFESHLALAYGYELMEHKLRSTPVKLHYFEKTHNRFDPRNAYRLARIIKENRFDAVVAHSSHALDYVLTAFAFLGRKLPLVALRRSGFVPSFWSKHLKYRFADRIVVVSKGVYELLKEKNFFPEKLVLIESGIDLTRFRPRPELRERVRAELGLKENELMLVNVANWQPWRKGQEVILKALKRLQTKNFKAFFVGLGTDSEEARRTFARYGLADRCAGLGFRSDVEYLLQGADLFLFGSFSEGIAGAVLQAMACGLVVVSTDAGGIPSYLKDGYNGFLVKVGDWEGMARKIEQALSLPKEK
ncbi:MAG: glycosyltransferase family 4 protein, partial [Aquificae bacterium]|nr:glycosyltransferase family 4 protein [Aquificota bacterium]